MKRGGVRLLRVSRTSYHRASAEPEPAESSITGERTPSPSSDATSGQRPAGAQNVARYADFAIFGNIAILCEGQDSSVSIETCEGLVNMLREPVGE